MTQQNKNTGSTGSDDRDIGRDSERDSSKGPGDMGKTGGNPTSGTPSPGRKQGSRSTR